MDIDSLWPVKKKSKVIDNFDLKEGEIRLMPIEEDMLPWLRDYRNDYNIRKWCRQVGLLSDHDQMNWYHKINNDKSINMFSIIRTENEDEGRLVGVCGLTSIDYINRNAEFSCYVGTEFRLSGYCSKALNILFRYGFMELNLHSIWGETFEHNPAMHLFNKMGMTKDGIRRQFYYKEGKYIDAILISITKSEFTSED